MKICRKCKTEKPSHDFSREAANPDGLCRWCRSCKATYAVENKANDREFKRGRDARYRRANRDRHIEYLKTWNQKNKESIREQRRLSYQENKAVLNKRNKERTNSCPMRRFSANVRSMTCRILSRRGMIKSLGAEKILGCTYSHLARHLESKFRPGMTWENRGQWHIDHIIPLASAKTEAEVIKLCHYTNLQPLWAKENLSKGAKILPEYSARAA